MAGDHTNGHGNGIATDKFLAYLAYERNGLSELMGKPCLATRQASRGKNWPPQWKRWSGQSAWTASVLCGWILESS